MEKSRLSRLGLALGGINLFLFVIILIACSFFSAQGGADSWFFLGPIIWNFPSSLLVMLLVPFRLPDFFLGVILACLGAGQWYGIGFLINKIVERYRRPKGRGN